MPYRHDIQAAEPCCCDERVADARALAATAVEWFGFAIQALNTLSLPSGEVEDGVFDNWVESAAEAKSRRFPRDDQMKAYDVFRAAVKNENAKTDPALKSWQKLDAQLELDGAIDAFAQADDDAAADAADFSNALAKEVA